MQCVCAASFTFLQRLQTLKGDFKLIGITELGWVVEDVDAQERYNRHREGY